MRAGWRAYSNADRWMRAAHSRALRGRFAARAWFTSLAGGLLLFGILGIFSPSSFGPTGRGRLGEGPALTALVALVLSCVVIGVLRRRDLRDLYTRSREPFVRPMTYEEHFGDTADALAACPDVLQSRWAMKWIYVPAGLVVAGVTFAFSSAYFAVGAILSLGRVGWGTPAVAAANVLLSLLAFSLAAPRAPTWRLAVSIHRDVTGRYLD